MKKFAFERQVIDPILNLIKKNQEYLTQPENLPQLAKLGYMYNTLWYAGRSCWGYNGLIKKAGKNGQCEDNPKYKIDICDPINGEIENWIYDAWAMHVCNEFGESWEEFSQIVLKGKELNDWEIKAKKLNKTFEEWVEVLTDERYAYFYSNWRGVANQLLCVNGNGYDYRNGFIVQEAGGADQDIDMYGDWENAIFRDDIKKTVDKIMAMPEVRQTIETAYNYFFDLYKKKQDKEDDDWKRMIGMTYKEYLKSDKYKKIHPEGEYHTYYPISKYPYSNISAFDENTHPSYIQAGIKICEDILVHKKEESKRPENIKFAKSFLKKFKV